ncbi:MAG TPA: hypothetical protein VGH44_05945 [Candidatus Saccharimonadia bacterium]|jgi:hypothetical protein
MARHKHKWDKWIDFPGTARNIRGLRGLGVRREMQQVRNCTNEKGTCDKGWKETRWHPTKRW